MSKIFYSWSDLNGLTAELIRNVTISNFKPDYVVGLTRGGNIPATMISHYLSVPAKTITLQLRDGGKTIENLDENIVKDALGYFQQGVGQEGKNILIVDDINDTGETFNMLKRMFNNMEPNFNWDGVWHNNVKFAVLIDNVASEAKVDFIGEEINKHEDNSWIVFPWENWWA